MAHRLVPEAEAKLDDMWWYIARKSGSVDIADGLSIPLLTASIFWLVIRLWGAAGTKIYPGLRSFPVGAYVLIYRIQDDDVLILQIVRGSRNVQALFSQ